MNYELSYRERHGLSESNLTEAQKALHYVAENMRMQKSISTDGYHYFQQAIEALGGSEDQDKRIPHSAPINETASEDRLDDTLDGTIKKYEAMAAEEAMRAGFETDNATYTMSEKERKDCEAKAEESRQIAGWLKELKQLREQTSWIPVGKKLPKTDNENSINKYNVLLWVKNKTHPEREPQIYLGKLRHVNGDDGSKNFWGIKTEPCDWTIWGWSYLNEPEVVAWMPSPQSYVPDNNAGEIEALDIDEFLADARACGEKDDDDLER